MQSNFRIALLMSAFFLPALASADEIHLPDSAATFHDLTRILDHNTLEKAKLEGARIKDEYSRLGTGGEVINGRESSMSQDVRRNTDAIIEETPKPTIDFIYGSGSSLRAKLRSPAGGTITVAKGDTAFNEFKVLKISSRSVILMDSDQITFTASSTPSGY